MHWYQNLQTNIQTAKISNIGIKIYETISCNYIVVGKCSTSDVKYNIRLLFFDQPSYASKIQMI